MEVDESIDVLSGGLDRKFPWKLKVAVVACSGSGALVAELRDGKTSDRRRCRLKGAYIVYIEKQQQSGIYGTPKADMQSVCIAKRSVRRPSDF